MNLHPVLLAGAWRFKKPVGLFLAMAIACCADAESVNTFPVTITVDASRPLGELKPIWRFFGAETPNYAYMKDWQKLLGELGESDVPVIVDTDGDVTLMVPWLLEAGVKGVLPLERQAGVDGMKLRQQFPRLRMAGHFDKMTMNRGEPAMRAEFERLVPLMKSGGFIPSVDHQTPPGVALDEYRCYLRLLQEYTQPGQM